MAKPSKQGKRSPLQQKPLRNAGDSVQYELEELLLNDILAVGLAAVLAGVFAAYEWARYFLATPPQPWPVTILAVGVALFAVYRFRQAGRRVAALKLGRDGEKVVAQYLEASRPPDWRLFNDIPGDGFNVDHVLIAPQGVFAIETKTISKPIGRQASVVYDGVTVSVDGHRPDRDPIPQARAERDWVRNALLETTGRHVPVRAVVVFPGWYVEQTKKGAHPEVWVCNEKALVKWVERGAATLSPEDIALYADRLRRRVTDE